MQTEGYLGHNPEKPPKPIRTSIERQAPTQETQNSTSVGFWGVTGDITVTTRQVTVTETDALFFPHR